MTGHWYKRVAMVDSDSCVNKKNGSLDKIFACANIGIERVNSQKKKIETVQNAKVHDRHIKSVLLFSLHIIITIQQSPYISSFVTSSPVIADD
jgi:hypothetical protein